MRAAGLALNALLPDGQPSWDLVNFEVGCSRCGYNLRMLTRPRCPECGLEFDWAAVLDRAAWRSDFLFEHHWRARPLRSWLATVWRSFRPFRFWKQVSIHDQIHVGPLWFMLLLSVTLFCVVLHGTAWVVSMGARALDRLHAPSGGYTIYDEVSDALDQFARLPFSMSWEYLLVPVAVLLTLLASLVLLTCLRQTLGRCRVRTRQVLRVVAYMAPPACLIGAVLFTGSITWSVVDEFASAGDLGAVISGVVIVATPPVVLALYLSAGLRVYLRLTRAVLLAVTAAGVGYLFMVTCFAFLQAH